SASSLDHFGESKFRLLISIFALPQISVPVPVSPADSGDLHYQPHEPRKSHYLWKSSKLHGSHFRRFARVPIPDYWWRATQPRSHGPVASLPIGVRCRFGVRGYQAAPCQAAPEPTPTKPESPH